MRSGVLVTSIPHNGTRVVCNNLLQGLESVCTNPGPGQVYRTHLFSEYMPRIMALLNAGVPCFVPIRHPLLVARSWKALSRQRMDPVSYQIHKLTDHWRRLVTAFMHYDVVYLPIDCESTRQSWLQYGRNITGLPLRVDWDLWPVLETGDLTLRELQLVESCYNELSPFFQRLGYDNLGISEVAA